LTLSNSLTVASVLIAVCRRLYHGCLTAPTFAGGPPPYPGVAA
jgi:hypothetical protein